MHQKALRSLRHSTFVYLAAMALAASASAHTVTVSSISEIETSWSNSYISGTNPLSSYGPVGSWTFQTAGSGGDFIVANSVNSLSAAGASAANLLYTWNLVWTPSNPTDVPGSATVVVQQRYQYSLGVEMGSFPVNLSGLSYTDFVDSNGGLAGVNDTINGFTPQSKSVTQSTWANGSLVTITGETWTHQANGTYTCPLPFPDSYLTRGDGDITDPYIAKEMTLMFSTGYTIQTTLISVADVNFTPWM